MIMVINHLMNSLEYICINNIMMMAINPSINSLEYIYIYNFMIIQTLFFLPFFL